MNKELLVSLLFLIAACAKQRSQLQTAWLTRPYTNEDIIELYHKADTIIRRNDSLLIINTRRDTIIVETGIFPYLQYGYPLDTPYAPVALTRQAMAAEKVGDQAEAACCYQTIVNYFTYQFLTRKSGFENGGFSDLNSYYAVNVNLRLLVSHAYEKLGRLPEARAVLARFMANHEATHTKIQQRFVELCVLQYGKVATRQALDHCGRTIHQNPNPQSVSDWWRVTVFEADLGLADFNTENMSPKQAQAWVYEQPFYKLVKQVQQKGSAD